MLIRRVYEVDPLCCLECGGQMNGVWFTEPPQADVIEGRLLPSNRTAGASAAVMPTFVRHLSTAAPVPLAHLSFMEQTGSF